MTEYGQQLWLLKLLAAMHLNIISRCQTSVTGEETIIICMNVGLAELAMHNTVIHTVHSLYVHKK